jgi:hypothetical protein
MGALVIGLLVAAIGAWSICGAILNLEVFMGHRKARSVVAILGQTGARVFFVALGVGMIALGTFVILAS